MNIFHLLNIFIFIIIICLLFLTFFPFQKIEQKEHYRYQGLTAAFIDLATYGGIDDYLYN